tara:strand:+ start:700 stop:903 length:204 start_codon:yes stop_codon:yes gene_type:complete
MAKPCANCPQLIHSSRKLCNKCSGVTAKTFEKAATKTKGGMVGGKWVSGNKKAAMAGMDELRGMLEI